MEEKIDVFQARVEEQFSEAPCLLFLLMRLIAMLRSFAGRFDAGVLDVPAPPDVNAADIKVAAPGGCRARSGRRVTVAVARRARVLSEAIDSPSITCPIQVVMRRKPMRSRTSLVGTSPNFSKNRLQTLPPLHVYIVTIC